jgi:hypothetical protein
MSPRWRSGAAARCMIAAAATSLVVSACSDGRSVEAFCQTYDTEKQAFLERYASVGQPAAEGEEGAKILLDLVMAMQSLGDATVILTKLEEKAPEEIRVDMSTVVQSWKDMQGSMGDQASNAFDPQGLIASTMKGMFMAAQSNGSWTRVGEYIETNCT